MGRYVNPVTGAELWSEAEIRGDGWEKVPAAPPETAPDGKAPVKPEKGKRRQKDAEGNV